MEYGGYQKSSNYLKVYTSSPGMAYFMRSAEKIDFSAYSKLCMELDLSYQYSASSSHAFLSTIPYYNIDNWVGDLDAYTFIKDVNTKKMVIDVSKITTNAYIYFRQTHTGTINVYKVWLEK